jgi:hypothetical protein
MQAASNDHDQIRKVIFGVPPGIFHDPATLDARKGMFNFDTNL